MRLFYENMKMQHPKFDEEKQIKTLILTSHKVLHNLRYLHWFPS